MKHRLIDSILLFNLKEQLMISLQNVSEVNRERSSLAAASSEYDSTKHNGLVTLVLTIFTRKIWITEKTKSQTFFNGHHLNFKSHWSGLKVICAILARFSRNVLKTGPLCPISGQVLENYWQNNTQIRIKNRMQHIGLLIKDLKQNVKTYKYPSAIRRVVNQRFETYLKLFPFPFLRYFRFHCCLHLQTVPKTK